MTANYQQTTAGLQVSRNGTTPSAGVNTFYQTAGLAPTAPSYTAASIYVTAGLPVAKNSGQTPTAGGSAFVTAGFAPDVAAAAGGDHWLFLRHFFEYFLLLFILINPLVINFCAEI